MIDEREVQLRLLELAAKTFGGVGSVHTDAQGIAKIATDWYNGIDSWKKTDTAPVRERLTLPPKAPPK